MLCSYYDPFTRKDEGESEEPRKEYNPHLRMHGRDPSRLYGYRGNPRKEVRRLYTDRCLCTNRAIRISASSMFGIEVA